ncbi:Fact complex subunit ssrp1 [Thalictrum thalictroides]|uniref:FACT complex subunit SSRP1 n=1 Tax=Thalictrum thalictroides TaxID=46969 RepID=A0A7J6XBB7_THATH|nr:Fact complex subunit ssrp1 [Thalictrum thalictroides]
MDKDDASGGEAVVKFNDVVAITPKGKYSVELHLSFFRLHGHANDFKIQYSSVVRLFLLPKSKRRHTFVVVTLEPPIREGPTLYPHIVLQFEKDFVVESTLVINKDLLISDYKDRLEASYKGLIHEVFTMILRGYREQRVGLLYPLKKEFFFLPKLPTRILIDEINDVDFERHGTGGRSMYYFDLRIRLKNRQEHVFLNIPKEEFNNLFVFLSEKRVRLMNFGQNQDVSADPHIERLKYDSAFVESDEEEDFVPENDSCGSLVDDSEEEESDGIESEDLNIHEDDNASIADSGEDDSDAIVSGEEKEEPRKEASTSESVLDKKRSSDGDEDGLAKRKEIETKSQYPKDSNTL